MYIQEKIIIVNEALSLSSVLLKMDFSEIIKQENILLDLLLSKTFEGPIQPGID